jgi:hypothetical protein
MLRRGRRPAFLSQVGKRTPVLARFSTVAEQGYADTDRDPRGFALKFYTEEGNYDLVGNNTPVFFVLVSPFYILRGRKGREWLPQESGRPTAQEGGPPRGISFGESRHHRRPHRTAGAITASVHFHLALPVGYARLLGPDSRGRRLG